MVAALVVVGLSCIVYLNIAAQEKSVKREVQAAAHIIADAVYNGVMVPMTQGDSDMVRKELEDLKTDLKGDEFIGLECGGRGGSGR